MKIIIKISTFVFIIFLFYSCKEKPTSPVISTSAVSEITTTSAVSGGNLTNDGGSQIFSKGVCWNTADNPTVNNSKTIESGSLGTFNTNLTQLNPSTFYYLRAYATNGVGTSYGNSVSFTTLGGKPFTNSLDASSITINSATLNGTVNPNSLPTTITFNWGMTLDYSDTISATQSPTNGNSFINVSALLSGLNPNITYHFRVKATNELGTTWSDDMTFTTFTSADIDNNFYHSVTIGTQVWLAENLKTTKFNDGTSIPLVINDNEWNSSRTPAYCWYNNDTTLYKTTYGALYNWMVVDQGMNGHKNVCPTSWHVPAKAEWATLFEYLTQNGYGYGGSGDDIGKSIAAKLGWDNDLTAGNVGNNQETNNRSGFTGLASGIRRDDYNSFCYVGYQTGWWAVPDDYAAGFSYWCNMIFSYSSIIYKGNTSWTTGLSIRCIKD
jgi:uncharacterized protein (TIGR02145 family)